MEMKNKLNEVPLANLNNQDLSKIKDLEKNLDEKYYLIAFKK
ncbi:hypothetical protein [Anaeromonas frigoriresistens]|nr:hypothetical protein [Anaeromonas frigoriresistens]